MGSSQEEFPLLSALGLYAADVRGDGNCLFSALSDQIYGHQKETHAIRSKVIDYMRDHADYYKQFIPVVPGGGTRRNPKRKNVGAYSSPAAIAPPSEAEIDSQFQIHLERMAKGGTYGDNLEITAFSSAFSVDVKIYQRDFAFMISGPGDHVEAGRAVAHIAYHTWEHYSSIRNLDGPHAGPPEVTLKALSPEEEKKQQEKLAQTPHTAPWMIEVVSKSLPYLADKLTIKRTLEECNGSVDAAVDKLLGAEENGSLSSAQESSSVEREPDSEDEYPGKNGPNKKRDRRLSSRHQNRDTSSPDNLSTLGSIANSQESLKLESSDCSGSRSEKKSGLDSANRPKPTIRLKFNSQRPASPASTPSSPTQQKSHGSPRQSAREKKDIKKQAQKAARKERQQAATKDGKTEVNQSSAGMTLRSKGMVNTPPIESGLRTLFI